VADDLNKRIRITVGGAKHPPNQPTMAAKHPPEMIPNQHDGGGEACMLDGNKIIYARIKFATAPY
jgi:hypothetical protein